VIFSQLYVGILSEVWSVCQKVATFCPPVPPTTDVNSLRFFCPFHLSVTLVSVPKPPDRIKCYLACMLVWTHVAWYSVTFIPSPGGRSLLPVKNRARVLLRE